MLVFTACVQSTRESNVLTRVCLSVHTRGRRRRDYPHLQAIIYPSHNTSTGPRFLPNEGNIHILPDRFSMRGVPHPSWQVRGYHHPSWWEVPLSSSPNGSTPIQVRSHVRMRECPGVTPGCGTPHWDWMGVPPPPSGLCGDTPEVYFLCVNLLTILKLCVIEVIRWGTCPGRLTFALNSNREDSPASKALPYVTSTNTLQKTKNEWNINKNI